MYPVHGLVCSLFSFCALLLPNNGCISTQPVHCLLVLVGNAYNSVEIQVTSYSACQQDSNYAMNNRVVFLSIE